MYPRRRFRGARPSGLSGSRPKYLRLRTEDRIEAKPLFLPFFTPRHSPLPFVLPPPRSGGSSPRCHGRLGRFAVLGCRRGGLVPVWRFRLALSERLGGEGKGHAATRHQPPRTQAHRHGGGSRVGEPLNGRRSRHSTRSSRGRPRPCRRQRWADGQHEGSHQDRHAQAHDVNGNRLGPLDRYRSIPGSVTGRAIG